MDKIVQPSKVQGEIKIPSSKSDAQRALIAAALAKGESTLHNFGNSKDEENLLSLVKKMGAIVVNENPLEIFGIGHLKFSGKYSIGESGLALRILTSIFALNAEQVVINGTGTLKKRSMHFFDDLFSQHGVSFESADGFLPFQIDGQLLGGDFEVDGSLSSQYISGLLMALPLAEGSSRLLVNNLNSKPYVQMTLNTLSKFGISMESKNLMEFLIHGGQHYLSAEYHIEGDWSSASYWLVAAALGAEVKVNGLSMSSLQADKQILSALMAAGCNVIFEADGITVNGEKRRPFSFDATHCPDLFPALVTLAAFTQGSSTIKGAKRLQNKESNRALALIKEFGKLGVQIEQVEDAIIVYGDGIVNGGIVNSHHDHRIAMCLGVAGLFSEESITIKHAEAVSKSYTNFWEHLESLERV